MLTTQFRRPRTNGKPRASAQGYPASAYSVALLYYLSGIIAVYKTHCIPCMDLAEKISQVRGTHPAAHTGLRNRTGYGRRLSGPD